MRALVTGGHGFVGGWLRAHLQAAGDDVHLLGADVTDGAAVAAEVAAAAPDAVYHLAARTHVGESWHEPAETFRVNGLGTVQLLDAMRALPRPPRVLLVSSAEVYGTVRPEQVPIDEETPLRPVTPYAASKVAAEFAGLQAHLGAGIPVIRVRAFNHAGPGQAGTFLLPALARRIVEAQRTGAAAVAVGNLSARRDYTDVRDVVRAYRLLVERGQPGEAYNVCSGVDRKVEDVARQLVELAGAGVELTVDPDLVRPVEIPVLRGDNTKLQHATGWRPELSFEVTLQAVLDEARAAAEG